MTATASIKAAPKITNGVNVTALFDTIEAVKAMRNREVQLSRHKHLAGAKRTARRSRVQRRASEHRTDGKAFVVDNGEAEVLLGEDRRRTRSMAASPDRLHDDDHRYHAAARHRGQAMTRASR